MTHRGPLGVPRPGVRCEPHLAVEIGETLTEQEKDQLQTNLENRVNYSVSVQEGVSFDEGDATSDVVFAIGGASVSNEEFDEVRNALIEEGRSIAGWRIGNV